MEFEYIRHGTTSLIGFFDVATGRMEMPYLNPTRTEENFVEAVRNSFIRKTTGYELYTRQSIVRG